MFENPSRGMQAKDFTKIVPKILDIKSSSEPIFSENCRWVPLFQVLYKSGLFFAGGPIFPDDHTRNVLFPLFNLSSLL